MNCQKLNCPLNGTGLILWLHFTSDPKSFLEYCFLSEEISRSDQELSDIKENITEGINTAEQSHITADTIENIGTVENITNHGITVNEAAIESFSTNEPVTRTETKVYTTREPSELKETRSDRAVSEEINSAHSRGELANCFQIIVMHVLLIEFGTVEVFFLNIELLIIQRSMKIFF